MKLIRIAEVTEPLLRSCLERTMKQIQSTRQVLSARLEKTQSSTTNHEVNQAPVYATVSKKNRSNNEQEASETSDSENSLPDEEMEASGMVSVELHAYKTVAMVESDCRPTQLMKVRSFSPPPSDGSDYDTINDKFLDLTTGCPIYDKVNSDTLNSEK